MILRIKLFVFLFMMPSLLWAQPYFVPKTNHGGMGKLGLDERIEYFNHLDSAFVVKQGFSEIIMNQTYYKDGKKMYDGPIVVYKFDKPGRRTYVEQTYWTDLGFTKRYTQYFKDSIINVQHEKYDYTDGNKRDARYVYKYIVLNDSLTSTIEQRFEFDSLVSTANKGTENHKAALREKIKQAQSEALLKALFETAHEEMAYHGPTLAEHANNLKSEPKPEIIKDALGRVTQVHQFYSLLNDKQSWITLPHSSSYLNYDEASNKVANITTFSHINTEKSQELIKGKSGSSSINDLKCFDRECIVYRYIATDFDAGIPAKIEVFMGKEIKLQSRYQCSIKRY